MKRRKPSSVAQPSPAPRRDCPKCYGLGRMESPVKPTRTAEDGRTIEYPAPLVECDCVFEQRRIPGAAPIDHARRAAGEREEG